jgi:hypothetical protein
MGQSAGASAHLCLTGFMVRARQGHSDERLGLTVASGVELLLRHTTKGTLAPQIAEVATVKTGAVFGPWYGERGAARVRDVPARWRRVSSCRSGCGQCCARSAGAATGPEPSPEASCKASLLSRCLCVSARIAIVLPTGKVQALMPSRGQAAKHQRGPYRGAHRADRQVDRHVEVHVPKPPRTSLITIRSTAATDDS